MDMAERFGQTSEAVRLKVGALIVKGPLGVIAEGVNGMPPDWPTEVCEDREYYEEGLGLNISDYPYAGINGAPCKLISKPECRHAEIAALEKLWNKTETADGAMMFVSHSPCKACAIKIKTAGIVKVYYRHPYRESSGIDFLRQNKIEVVKLN